MNPGKLERRTELTVDPSKPSDPSKDTIKLSLCRCWRSAKFPYCDGAHKALNEGGHSDHHVGPVVVFVKTTPASSS